MMAMIIRSKFSTVLRLRWPDIRSFCIAEFSSQKETGDSVDSQSNLGSGDDSVPSDSVEHASSTSTQDKTGLEKAMEMFDRVEQMTTSEHVQPSTTADEKPVSFASMLLLSKLIAIGKPACCGWNNLRDSE